MKNILLVDDDRRILDVVRDCLEANEYHLTESDRGETALYLLRNDTPDLVILDITLPGMDGIEACRRVKEDPVLSQVKVAILTGSDDPRTRDLAMDAGADDYVTKPFSPVGLRQTIESMLT